MLNIETIDILKYAPVDIQLYHIEFGYVRFLKTIETTVSSSIYIESDGKVHIVYSNELSKETILFPDENKTWDNWQYILFPKSIGSLIVKFKNIDYLKQEQYIITSEKVLENINGEKLNISDIDLTNYKYGSIHEYTRFLTQYKANHIQEREPILLRSILPNDIFKKGEIVEITGFTPFYRYDEKKKQNIQLTNKSLLMLVTEIKKQSIIFLTERGKLWEINMYDHHFKNIKSVNDKNSFSIFSEYLNENMKDEKYKENQEKVIQILNEFKNKQ